VFVLVTVALWLPPRHLANLTAGGALLVCLFCIAQWLRQNDPLAGFQWRLHMAERALTTEERRRMPYLPAPSRQWEFAGVALTHELAIGWLSHPDSAGAQPSGTAMPYLAVRIPYWLVILPTLPVMAWWWMRRRREKLAAHRRRYGLCLACGYDLRASSGECPECGERKRK
jgi:hypothetical protein